MRGIYGLVILAEELSAFLLRQVPQDDLRIIWFLGIDKLGDHDGSLRSGTDSAGGKMRHHEAKRVPGPPPHAPVMMQNGDERPAAHSGVKSPSSLPAPRVVASRSRRCPNLSDGRLSKAPGLRCEVEHVLSGMD
jgi:hypothetical protein